MDLKVNVGNQKFARPSNKNNELVEELNKEVSRGNIEAQVQLGNMYKSGFGVPQDSKKAASCLSHACKIGSAGNASDIEKQAALDAALSLSELCADEGKFDESVTWLKKANFVSENIVDPEERTSFLIIEKARELATKFSHIEEGLFQTADDKPAILYLLFARGLVFSVGRDHEYAWSKVRCFHLLAEISYQLGDLYLNCRFLNRDEKKACTCFDEAFTWGRNHTNAHARLHQLTRKAGYQYAPLPKQSLTVAPPTRTVFNPPSIAPDEREDL